MLLFEPAHHPHAQTEGSAPQPPYLRLLSAMSGSHTIESCGRTLVVDPDCFLLLHSAAAVFCTPGAALLSLDFAEMPLRSAMAGADLPHFHEHLRLIEEPVATQLARVRREPPGARRSTDAGATLVVDLLQSIVDDETDLQRRAQAIACVKPSTRLELVRRVLLASDFILSHHASPIRLDDVARAAHLSRFHLVRLFRQLLGVTPHTHLLNKRLAAARRLLADGRSDMIQVAEMSGFGNRWSLFRRLQRRPDEPVPPRRPPPPGLRANSPPGE